MNISDRGGTFTDVIAFYPDGSEKIFKLLSSDPKNYSDAANEAIRRILEEFEGRALAKKAPLDLKNIGELIKSSRLIAKTYSVRFTPHGHHCGNECFAGETGSPNGIIHHQGIQSQLRRIKITKK